MNCALCDRLKLTAFLRLSARLSVALFVTGSLITAFGQLAPDQKQADFLDTVGLYAKHYGAYPWKRDVIGFDLEKVQPWLDRIAATQNDIDFYEVMVEYVASLQDSHDHYAMPSSFSAGFGFTTDIFDGLVLVDSVNRNRLPLARYAIGVGDQVVSIDGTAVQDLIPKYSIYVQQGNPRSTQRRAANAIFNRFQSSNPNAANVGQTAVIVLNRVDGSTVTLTLPWGTAGLPFTSIDPAASPQRLTPAWGVLSEASSRRKPATGMQASSEVSGALGDLQTSFAFYNDGELANGSFYPVFNPPPDFKMRLGGKPTDYFLSGTFPSGAYTLGFIRIATYGPADTSAALQQFAAEMAYFQQNADGLIIDQMRNPGGLLCYGESIVSYLMPNQFRPLGYEIRATREYLQLYYSDLQAAIASGAPQTVIDQYQTLFNAVQAAYSTNNGRTSAIPLCTASFDRAPAKDGGGNTISYTKPLVFLTDEFSSSTADSVPAMLQDNARGQIVGFRTNGAGGSNSLNTSQWNAGAYSEGTAGITLSMMVRKNPVSTPEFPTTSYIENVGVRPDVMLDYMTRDNLLNGGQTFLNAATGVLLQQIQGSAAVSALSRDR